MNTFTTWLIDLYNRVFIPRYVATTISVRFQGEIASYNWRLTKGTKIAKKLDLTADLPKEINESKKDQLVSKFKKLTQRKKSNS